MERILQPSEYSFTAASKTVAITLASGGTVRLGNLKLIINQTDNIIIFSSTNTSKKATLAGSTFTLEYDTTSMSDTDILKILYFDEGATAGLATAALQTTLNAKDFATQTTLAALLAKVIAAPSTEAKQDSMITLLTAIAGYVDGLEAKDYATQTTLAAVLAKIIAAPSTEAKQDTIIGHIDGLETAFTTLNAKDFATQTTLAAILAKIIAAPSTEAKQDTIITHIDGLETAFTTLNAKDFATQTTLAAILAKIIAAPATEAKQDTEITHLSAIQTAVQLIDNAISGNEMQVDVITLPSIPAGTNNIGDVDVLTLPAIPSGTNTIGDVGIKPRTSGGLTTYHLVSAASTNATVVKNSAGQLFGWYIYNSNAAARKVTFHNASSTPTAGASVFFSLVIPAGSGANVFSEIGIPFSTGIAITTVTGLADSDSTGVALNDLIINLFYS